MNKHFARKFVNWQIETLGADAKMHLTMGDVMDVAKRVANDELDLAYVADELRWLEYCNRELVLTENDL